MTRATNDLTDLAAKIRAGIRDAGGPQILRAMGLKAIDLIRKRTRLGYGVPPSENGTAERQRLFPLSPGYVKFRSRSNLNSLTSGRRSNLTFTGQLLDSLQVLSIGQGKIVIGPNGTHRGSGRKKYEDNAQIAEWVAEQGRPFLNLSRAEGEQLRRFYRNAYGDLLRNRRIAR